MAAAGSSLRLLRHAAAPAGWSRAGAAGVQGGRSARPAGRHGAANQVSDLDISWAFWAAEP